MAYLPFFSFTHLLEMRGIDPATARLVRHNRAIEIEYVAGQAFFRHAITYQAAGLDPFRGAATAFQFLPGPVLPDGAHSALFVGAHVIVETWPYGDGSKRTSYHFEHPRCYVPQPQDRAYELRELDEAADLAERILIRWGQGPSTRAWSQWAASNPKEIVEVRRTAEEPTFPGFSAFASTLEDLPLAPQNWRNILASVRGVYLLVCPETGTQYVGSAYGEDGFWGRWSAYVVNGHGGNILLRARGRANYAISILEIASPDMAPSDIIRRETAWKVKLGARAHGLNAN
jgi:hypothetical protein